MKRILFIFSLVFVVFIVGCDRRNDKPLPEEEHNNIQTITPQKPEVKEHTITIKYPTEIKDTKDKITVKEGIIFGRAKYDEILPLVRKNEITHNLKGEDFYLPDGSIISDNHIIKSNILLTTKWEPREFDILVVNTTDDKNETVEKLKAEYGSTFSISSLSNKYLTNKEWEYNTLRNNKKLPLQETLVIKDHTIIYNDLYKRTDYVKISLDLNDNVIRKSYPDPIFVPVGGKLKELPLKEELDKYNITEKEEIDDKTTIIWKKTIIGWSWWNNKDSGFSSYNDKKTLLNKPFKYDCMLYAIWNTSKTTIVGNVETENENVDQTVKISFTYDKELVAKEVPKTKEIIQGEEIGYLELPKYDSNNYFFIGWFYDISYTPALYNDKILKDITLIPKFHKIEIPGKSLDDYKTYSVLYVPEHITKIDKAMFKDNKHLEVIYLNKNITSIEDEAFKNSNIRKVFLHENGKLQYIGEKAFENSKLEHIYFPENNVISNRITFGKDVFSNCLYLEHIKIPHHIGSSDNILSGCANLKYAYLNTKILPKGAFSGCVNLIEVENVKLLEDIKENAFKGCSNLIKIPKFLLSNNLVVEKGTLEGCSNLKEITIYSTNEDISIDFTNLEELKNKTIIIIGKADITTLKDNQQEYNITLIAN